MVGSKYADGYVHIEVNELIYKAHRLAFLYVKGRWPKGDVDHKDRIRHHNAWTNLREATFSQNRFNATKRSDNKSGYTGVTIFGNKFQASIQEKGKRIHLGTFTTAKAANRVYQKKAAELYGNYFTQ